MTKDLQTRLSEDGKRIAAIERQRDRLAEALRCMELTFRKPACDADPQTEIAALAMARAALAELEKP